jgi:hypothetical protein
MIAVKAREIEGKSRKVGSPDFLSLEALGQLVGLQEKLLSDANVILQFAPEHVKSLASLANACLH